MSKRAASTPARVQRPSEILRYVIIPLAQAGAIAFAVSVGTLTIMAAIALILELRVRVVFGVTSLIAGVTFCIVAVRLVLEYKPFLWTLEEALRRDLDDDEIIGDPRRAQDPSLIYVRDGGRRHKALLDALDFRYWLRKVYSPRWGTDWRSWKGHRLPSRRVISQEQWSAWCDRLLQAGFAMRAHDKAPIELQGTCAQAELAFSDLFRGLPTP